jgi:tetratricopeptide (TPR) repeat protein
LRQLNEKALTSIIILATGQSDITWECLQNIQIHTPELHEIIIVKSVSKQETAEWPFAFLSATPSYKIVEHNETSSFSHKCNKGITVSTGRYIILLKDIVIVTKDWLSGMLECLDSSPDIGIVGPVTDNADGPQKVPTADPYLFAHLDQFSEFFRERNRFRRVPVKNLKDFCMLFTRNLVEKIGLFDEKLETVDFSIEDYCLRASLEGYRNMIAGDVFVHLSGHNTLTNNGLAHSADIVQDRNFFIDKWRNFKSTHEIWQKVLIVNALNMADDFIQKGKTQDGIEILHKALDDAPDDRRLCYFFLETLIFNKRFTEVLDTANHLPAFIKNETRYLELIGSCKESMGLYDEAEDYAHKVLKLNPASPKALNLKGSLAFKKGLLADAESFFQESLQADKSYGETYSNLGTLRWIAKDREEAYKLFEKAFILSPTSEDILTNYYTAVIALSKLHESESILKGALALYPLNKRLHFVLLDNLLQQEKYKEAMNIMEEVLAAFDIYDENLTLALGLRDMAGISDPDKLSHDTISVCMIVKNEENNIARALTHVKPIGDEIIVVDTGSTDRTRDIARAFGAKVYDFTWSDSFSDARNFSLSKASGRWIFVLDADEVVSYSDCNSLKDIVKQSGSEAVAYSFVTRNYVMPVSIMGWIPNDGRYIKEEAGTGWFPSDKVRLFPNNSLIRFENPVHELVEPSLRKFGIEIKRCQIPVHHYGKLTKNKKIAKGTSYYELGKAKLAGDGQQQSKNLYEMALQASELGKYQEAIEYWEKLIINLSDFSPAYYGLGVAYFKLARYEEATSSAEKALQLEPAFKEAVTLYANCKICTGDVETAINYLEKLLKESPAHISALLALAIAYFSADKKKSGLECVKTLQNMNFSCEKAFLDFAKILLSAKQIKYAISLLEALIETNHASNETHTLLTEVCKMRIEP